MKVGITLVMVLFASILIEDTDAIQCHECTGLGAGGTCKDSNYLGKLVKCAGYCMKIKTSALFFTISSGLYGWH